MNKIFATLAVLATLTACGADVEAACDSYLDSVETCLEEVYADDQATFDSTWSSFESTCDAYQGLKDQESADYLDCLNAAYADADCSSAESYGQTLDISGCSI